MRILVVVLLWFLHASIVYNPNVRPVFALQVSMQPNSQLFSIVAYIYNGRTLAYRKPMTRDEFVKIASGKWPSVYNPQRIDMLSQNGISCGVVQDSISKKDIVYCLPLDSIWKLRFSDYPFRGNNEKGWSQQLNKPSSKQIIYLHEKYGVEDLDFSSFSDSAFWNNLRDVQNPDWVKKYKNL
jgi:hypothetical protein